MTTKIRLRKRKMGILSEEISLNPTATSLYVSDKNPDFLWSPIKDIPDSLRKYRTDLRSLKFIWGEQKDKLSDTTALKDFNDKLIRLWSIETGILEKLYDLDRGITETLVTHGFEASLIPHGSGVNNPNEVISMLKDHSSALDLVFDYIKNNRPLTTSFIKELHSLFTIHQDTTDALDQLG